MGGNLAAEEILVIIPIHLMYSWLPPHPWAVLGIFLAAMPAGRPAVGGETVPAASPIDLAAALRLAGAQDLDVALAREKLAAAQADLVSAQWRFFPWIEPGVTYFRHDNLYQNGAGLLLDSHKEDFYIGPSVTLKLDLGDAIYSRLAARQLVHAAASGLEGQRQEAVLATARGYFDLARTQLAVGVVRDAVRIAEEYASQVRQAADHGQAFKGDALQVQVQTDRNRLELGRALEATQLAAAQLAATLHVDPAVELVATDGELVPINLLARDATRGTLISQALAHRPELAQHRSEAAAARAAEDGAIYGPLYPIVGAQIFAGALGGSGNGVTGTTGQTEDYLVTVGWRIGPGGLFDSGRIRAAESRVRAANLSTEKVADEIVRQVVDSYVRLQSLADQMDTARRALGTATEALRLTQARGDFAVGVVLENIQAQQVLTRTRLDYLDLVTEFDIAGYALQRAIGGL